MNRSQNSFKTSEWYMLDGIAKIMFFSSEFSNLCINLNFIQTTLNEEMQKIEKIKILQIMDNQRFC